MPTTQLPRITKQSVYAYIAVAIVLSLIVKAGAMFIQEHAESQPPDCVRTMPVADAQAVLDAHQDMKQRIEGLSNDGGVWVEIATDVCPGNGFIRIFFGTERQRKQIKEMLGQDFFGVLYTLHNI